jgi:hypothetical protein
LKEGWRGLKSTIINNLDPAPGWLIGITLGKMGEINFKNNQPPRPERTLVLISIITGRATPPSKGGDIYVINIQLNTEKPPKRSVGGLSVL